MALDRRVLQSPAMQSMVEEIEWMLVRRAQRLRAERLAARTRKRQQHRRARKQELRRRCMRTLRQLNRSSLRCDCHDFACWQYLWKRDPEIATVLRRTGHHLPFCKLSLEESDRHYRKEFLCPYSGWSFDEVPSEDGETSGDEYDNLSLSSDDEELQGDFTIFSAEGGSTWVREHGEDYLYRPRKCPGGFVLLERKAVRDATEHSAPGDGLQCCVSHPIRFLDYGTTASMRDAKRAPPQIRADCSSEASAMGASI